MSARGGSGGASSHQDLEGDDCGPRTGRTQTRPEEGSASEEARREEARDRQETSGQEERTREDVSG